MIKSIKITNFSSIGKTQEISFEITPKNMFNDSATQIFNQHINLVNCFIGNNASGKTTVLKAISFLFWLMSNSYASMKADDKIPLISHRLYNEKPTRIEIEFFNQDGLFQYYIELDQTQIHKEFLGEKYIRGYKRIFQYERSKNDWNFKATSKMSVNKSDLLRFKERKNISVLSSLIETGYLPNLAFIKRFETNVTNMGHLPLPSVLAYFDISKFLYIDIERQKDALKFIEAIDIGISGFEFFESLDIKNDKQRDKTEKQTILLECIHQSDSKKFKLALFEESNGTIHSLQLLTKILPILETGGFVILDEIESGLHPYVTKKIISLFERKETNPRNAQLIFSTHQHLLLNDRTKTQIFITEKDNKKFETEVFRLDDMEGVRNEDNYFNKYLAGTYGGIPHIKWLDV